MARLIISRQHPHPFHHATRIILLSDLLPNTVWFTVHQGGDNFQDVAGTNQTKPPFHTAAVGYSTRTSLMWCSHQRHAEYLNASSSKHSETEGLVTAGILFYFYFFFTRVSGVQTHHSRSHYRSHILRFANQHSLFS